MIHDGQDYFCVRINHPLALKVTEDPDLREPGTFSMRGHSIGGFGSVTTNKVIATIAGDVFGKDVQAYPKYGSEKKGLPTTYYLSIAEHHILMHSELEQVDLVVLNDTTALFSGNPLKGLVRGAAVVMQSPFANPVDVWQRVPPQYQRFIREQEIRVYYIDMVQIAREVASLADLQMRMQGIVLLGAFLKLTPYGRQSDMTAEQIYAGVEKALRKYFGKRGERVVQDNLNCVKRGYSELMEVPQELMR
jgi:pyruvate-ferredoxin/flavodoxin oxidoreductase